MKSRIQVGIENRKIGRWTHTHLVVTQMDAEALTKLCESLSIDEDVKDTVTLEGDLHKKGEKMMSFCLAGRVLATKEVNREAFKNMVQQS